MKKLLKKDVYSSRRGGTSQILIISCRKCQSNVLAYQKDGPGSLRRMYLDLILAPENLKNQHNEKLSEIKALTCGSCFEILAHPYIYKKENRLAYRVFVESIIKNKISQKEFRKAFLPLDQSL